MTDRLTFYRCAECGFLTVGGSVYGCVSCLTRREPEPFEVVPADVYDEAVGLVAELYDSSGAGGDLAPRVNAYLAERGL